jgi:hypothetical protein
MQRTPAAAQQQAQAQEQEQGHQQRLEQLESVWRSFPGACRLVALIRQLEVDSDDLAQLLLHSKLALAPDTPQLLAHDVQRVMLASGEPLAMLRPVHHLMVHAAGRLHLLLLAARASSKLWQQPGFVPLVTTTAECVLALWQGDVTDAAAAARYHHHVRGTSADAFVDSAGATSPLAEGMQQLAVVISVQHSKLAQQQSPLQQRGAADALSGLQLLAERLLCWWQLLDAHTAECCRAAGRRPLPLWVATCASATSLLLALLRCADTDTSWHGAGLPRALQVGRCCRACRRQRR